MITVPAQLDEIRTVHSHFSDMVVAAKEEAELALSKAHEAYDLSAMANAESKYHEDRLEVMEETMVALRSTNTHLVEMMKRTEQTQSRADQTQSSLIALMQAFSTIPVIRDSLQQMGGPTVPQAAEPPASESTQQDGPAPDTPSKRSLKRAKRKEEERQAREEAAAAAAAEDEDGAKEMAPSTPLRAPSGQRTWTDRQTPARAAPSPGGTETEQKRSKARAGPSTPMSARSTDRPQTRRSLQGLKWKRPRHRGLQETTNPRPHPTGVCLGPPHQQVKRHRLQTGMHPTSLILARNANYL